MGSFFKVIGISGIGLLWIVLGGCGDAAETHVENKGPAQKVRWVNVRPIERAAVGGSLEYVGVLTAHRKAEVASELGGTIERLYFEKGDHVSKGQLLAEIGTSRFRLEVRQAQAAVKVARSQLQKIERGSRPEEILIAKAALREARAAFVDAEKNFKRLKDLYGLHAVSNMEYDRAKRQLDMTLEKVEAAKQHLTLAREGPRDEDKEAARANLEQARARLALALDYLKRSQLFAPCDGIIAFREVEEGEVIVVPPGKTLTQVIDLRDLRIRISVSENDVPLLKRLTQVAFSVDAIPRETFRCRLSFVSPTADPITRSFPAEFIVERTDKRMADGMSVRVRLPLEEGEKNIRVPSAWLWEEDGTMGIFVVKGGKCAFRKVTLGAYYDQRVEILSGLSQGDMVITNPAGLKSGDPVRYKVP